MNIAFNSFCKILLTFAIVCGASALAAAHGTTERVSVNASGVQGNYGSGGDAPPSISMDGRFVAFASAANNLVPGDTNDQADIFVRDRKLGKIERVSVGLGGAQSNGWSVRSVISMDGRFVAFFSSATNLVPGDTNGLRDIFVRDRKINKTERVNVGSSGIQANGDSYGVAISGDGRFVTFDSEANNLITGVNLGLGPGEPNVFVRDRQTGTTELASLGDRGILGNGPSTAATISADGRFVAFASYASNLVPGDTNDTRDIFVRDRKAGTTERVSVGSNGVQANINSIIGSISANGRFVVFDSFATNLVSGDSNRIRDIFVRDRKTGTTERVNVGPGGIQANSYAIGATISANGRFVAFQSNASNLIRGGSNNQHIFIRDRKMDRTRLVSVGPRNIEGNERSNNSQISVDGKFVIFDSLADNLVLGDSNDEMDVFVRILMP